MGWMPSVSTWAIVLVMPTLVFIVGSWMQLPLPKLTIFALLNVMAALWTRTIYRRLVRDTALPQPWHSVALVGVVLFGISSCLGPAVSRLLATRDGSWLGTIMLVCCASNVFLVPLTIILDLIFWLRQPTQASVSHGDAKQRRGAAVRNAQVARKKAAILLALTLAFVTLALIQGAQEPTMVHVDVYLKGLPPAADGFVLVQVSDLHVGAVIGHRFMSRLVERLNTVGAGAVAIIGDLVDCHMVDCGEALEPLAHLRAPAFFVTGNHEYLTANVPALLARLRMLHVRPLRNEHVTIPVDGEPAFVLAGVDDWTAGDFGLAEHRPNVGAALAGRPAELPAVLLAHQPRQIHEADKHRVDLMLSGHTHSGQIFPLHVLAWLGNPYFAGLYQHSDTTAIYVGSGTAFWGPPMRLFAPAEITIVHLHPQRSQV